MIKFNDAPQTRQPAATDSTSWGLRNAEWRRLAPDPMAELLGDVGDIDAAEEFRRAGYSMSGHDVDEYAPAQIREAAADNELTAAWPWLVEFCVCDGKFDRVYVATLPDLLSLVSQVSALNSAHHLGHLDEFIGRVGRRAFRAWHGHDDVAVCQECDPTGYERRRAARERRGGAV